MQCVVSPIRGRIDRNEPWCGETHQSGHETKVKRIMAQRFRSSSISWRECGASSCSTDQLTGADGLVHSAGGSWGSAQLNMGKYSGPDQCGRIRAVTRPSRWLMWSDGAEAVGAVEDRLGAVRGERVQGDKWHHFAQTLATDRPSKRQEREIAGQERNRASGGLIHSGKARMDTRQKDKEKEKEKDMAPGEGTPKTWRDRTKALAGSNMKS
ncbi:hypothetical protein F2Q70_00025556 [Brassica cretica]|uniref:Uncharacterized protein n=1 Tax=Brassica cretica TaxID=69181 RepID=A0A8S9L8Z2_BRACR|nr:hypothetical protein F2Q70_00025556 [Brassica cretica]